MILTCPQCATRYLLPAHMLTSEGRRVKCSNCTEIWFQLPDSTEIGGTDKSFEDIPEGVKPLQEGSNLPTVSEEEETPRGFTIPGGRLTGYGAAAGAFVVIFVALLLLQPVIANALTFTHGFYKMLGYEFAVAGEGLVFDSMTAEKKPGEGGEKIIIAGRILNLKYQNQSVPMIEASMRTRSGDILEHWIIRPPADHLGPKDELPFNTEYKVPQSSEPHDINLQFVAGDVKTASAGGDNNPAPAPADPAHPSAAE